MPDKCDKHVLKNGMIILGNQMDNVESVAFKLRLPCGESLMPEGCCGAGSCLTDWILRGAGTRNSKELVDAMDGLGLHRGSSVTSSHVSLSSALESSNLSKALDLYADIILRPHLNADQFELSKQLAIADLLSLDDDPRHKVMLNLYERFYPHPFGRPSMGKMDELKSLTADRAKDIVAKGFNLSSAIFSVAGKYDFQTLCDQLEQLFDIEQNTPRPKPTPGQAGAKYTHIQHDAAQIHIGMMTKADTIASADYYNMMTAVSILSGSMSSRLFTEVREKRGLCYAVGARYNTLKDFAGISCYTGTTPDKAQEAFDVIKSEFARLTQGVTQDEVDRAKVGLKSSLIMQSESTSSRASGIASDHYLLGRVRSIGEIKSSLESVDKSTVDNYLADNTFNDFTVITIGPKTIDC